MEKPRETFTADEEATVVLADEEQTLVAPRFDDEETLVARPVVPLGEAESRAPEAPAATVAPTYMRARVRRLPSRTTLLALMLCSILIGGVLGGAGLYLYQRQSGDTRPPATAAPAAATSQPAAPAPNETSNEAAQPAPSPTAEALSPTPEAPHADAATNAPSAAESNAPKAPADEGRAGSDDRRAAPAPEAESVPAGAPKRGKKGERDEELERSARRVDTIFYRPRRAATRDRARRQTDGDAERLRRIFEGSPE